MKDEFRQVFYNNYPRMVFLMDRYKKMYDNLK